ncbi:MAG: hypothetical protein P8X64_05805 [Anaerolineales bacterium]
MKPKRVFTYSLIFIVIPILVVGVVLIAKCQEEGACRWNFFRTFPTKWEGPQANAESAAVDETAIASSEESLELPLEGNTASPTNTKLTQPTETEVILRAKAIQGARCRFGPNTVFPTLTYLYEADEVILVARDPTGFWMLISKPSASVQCWVWRDLLDPTEPVESLLIDPGPPLPTWTPEPTIESRKTGCWVLNDPNHPQGICKPSCGPNDQPATPCEL